MKAPEPGFDRERIALWEDLLTLVVDPQGARAHRPQRARQALEFLLRRAGVDAERFWEMGRAQRARLFLSRYSRVSREVPQLEMSAFDIDKALKERFRHEPLTLGAAWHHGFWRSYFSHAAITHPANDGLREEFSTAWDIVRKHPAVLFRTEGGGWVESPLRGVRLDMPMIVGPLPYSDGEVMERAYLEAMAGADPQADLQTRSLLVVEAASYLSHRQALAPFMPHILLRLDTPELWLLDSDGAPLREALLQCRVAELVWQPDLERWADALLALNPALILSVYLRYGEFGDETGFWSALEQSARTEGVALVHYHSGREKSYRLTPRIDAFLKARLLRARVQLVSAGGDTDTLASAATVYESVLLGANGGAMTHVASLALAPELTDVLYGADPEPMMRALQGRDRQELRDLALSTLTCWQHTILDFLSCMGIDDIQKTSGNTMAITLTEDWVRQVDGLASEEFGRLNEQLNRRRVEAEPVPSSVRERFRVSRLMQELRPALPVVLPARSQRHGNANYHLNNSNRNLNADFLDVIYRMAEGALPGADDFFIDSDMGPWSLDAVGVKLGRASLEWSLERLRRDPPLLDYVSLAVPRGFHRPGAVEAGASAALMAGNDATETQRHRDGEGILLAFEADERGGFEVRVEAGHPAERALQSEATLSLVARGEQGERRIELLPVGSGGGGRANGMSVLRASADGAVTLRRDPRGGVVLSGFGFREPIWHGPVGHASISLGAASEDFLVARIEGNAGLTFTSSGEGGPIRLERDQDMAWESLQAASGHFGIHAADLRRVRDVEIKINQGAKPGKGGRLAGPKVTATVSKARNIPVGTDALSPDPKHDIYSIEDMPAEVWLWLLYHNHCGIKITGSNYTKYVAAGMWSNFVVDYLLVDSGLGGSGNYHADSSHVGWPDIFRTILHTHHALVGEKVDLDGSGTLRTIRDLNGAPFGAGGGTRLFASGGLRGELDMLKVFLAGADGLVEASIGKAAAFGCNQCGNCHLDCPRGGITTKHELTLQNDRGLMRLRFRNWTVLNMVKLAVLVDALNRESGALDQQGRVADPAALIDDIRKLRGRTDLLVMPRHPAPPPGVQETDGAPEREIDSCRVGSLAVTVPVGVGAIWEAARQSYNGGNNRGGGIDFAGFAPEAVRGKTCLVFNTIGPDRAQTMAEMLGHLAGCRVFDASGLELPMEQVRTRLPEFRIPVRARYAAEQGWRAAGLREDPGDFTLLFVALRPEVLRRYGHALLGSEHWLQRRTKYGDLDERELKGALDEDEPGLSARQRGRWRIAELVQDVKEEYFSALAHLLDSRYYRMHAQEGIVAPAGKYAAKRRGFLVSMGEDIAAVKISGWTHLIPEYFDLDRLWSAYPGGVGGDLRALAWGMHHRYPTNSPAIDAEGRGNPAGAHPFKAYNLLLMHNGEQVGVDSTSPFLNEFGFVHADPSMGPGAELYHGDSVYERKALTDTEYAAYLCDFTRRVLGLDTEEATQVISPITGLDLARMDDGRRSRLQLLTTNYIQLTPTGPYKFTILETRHRRGESLVGFRENMDIKFLRPHEIVVSKDTGPAGVQAVANGSEAKIADVMLRVLHQQGILGDPAADLRFNMRPGGNPGQGDFGGVVEAFTAYGSARMEVRNRFGEPVPVDRAGEKLPSAGTRAPGSAPGPDDFLGSLTSLASSAFAASASKRTWAPLVRERLDEMMSALSDGGAELAWRPDAPLPAPAEALLDETIDRMASLSFPDYRYLAEEALPELARSGARPRALALRVLSELRKRLQFGDAGGKALSSLEYLADGGRAADGSPEGGIYRVLDAVPPLFEALRSRPEPLRWGRLTFDTRDDLLPPDDPERDVLVIDFAGFRSESFGLDSASRILSEAVRLGWRRLVGYDFVGGPRYVATNLADADGTRARGVVLELYGREFGDFLGALLEGAEVWVYGQGQSHWGLKADSGYLFVLQDALNTCMYAAHGGTINLWDSGSRFAVAGQNKVYYPDEKRLAPGFKSIHFGSPNEYAFEYLMSGGPNSLHVVMGLRKPDARGQLSLRPRPYAGKFLMSGAAAGRVFIFDPQRKLEPAQYRGNVPAAIPLAEWAEDLGPFLATEARRRGAPVRIEGEQIALRMEGAWRSWRYDEAFTKLIPIKVAKAAQEQGIVPPALVQMVAE